MTNPERGEVAAIIGNRAVVLRYTADALCALEETLDRGIIDITGEMRFWGPPLGPDGKTPLPETADETAQRLGRIRLTTLRALLWAGLRERQPDLSLKEAGEMILTTAGGIAAVLEPVAAAVASAFAREGDQVRPREPAAAGDGTGASS